MTNLDHRAAIRLRAALRAEGISIAEYAKEAGMSADTASKKLEGHRQFRLSDLEAAGRLTGYPTENFISSQPFTLKEPDNS